MTTCTYCGQREFRPSGRAGEAGKYQWFICANSECGRFAFAERFVLMMQDMTCPRDNRIMDRMHHVHGTEVWRQCPECKAVAVGKADRVKVRRQKWPAELELEIEELKEGKKGLEDQIDRMHSKADDMYAELQESKREAERQKGIVHDAGKEIERLRGMIQSKNTKFDRMQEKLGAENDRLRKEIDRLVEAGKAKDSEIEHWKDALHKHIAEGDEEAQVLRAVFGISGKDSSDHDGRGLFEQLKTVASKLHPKHEELTVLAESFLRQVEEYNGGKRDHEGRIVVDADDTGTGLRAALKTLRASWKTDAE